MGALAQRRCRHGLGAIIGADIFLVTGVAARCCRAIPWLGLAGCLAMSVSLPLNVILSGVILLEVGFWVRWLVKKM